MTTWGLGDYPLMARHLKPAARAVVDCADIRPADRVLDVATGTGNAAMLAAAQGASTVGVDFEPALLAIADSRAAAAGLRVRWLVGEMSSLPVPGESADVVTSVFGVMYAPDPPAAASELARVASHGARVVLGIVGSKKRDALDGPRAHPVPAAASSEQRIAEQLGGPRGPRDIARCRSA